jgi:outer membrane protein assembly factor BamB
VNRLVAFFCLVFALCSRADDWPQWLGPQRDGIWRETGIAQAFPATGPKIRWRTSIGAGYSGPAVAGGKAYITDRMLPPRGTNSANPFDKRSIPGLERVLCLDESDGKIIWRHEYDCPYNVSYPAGPRATPLIAQGKVYTLGTEGHLFCFRAATGKELWSRQFKEDFGIETPLWGFSAHPLLDGNKLICLVGGKGSVAVAFDKETGKELWRALSAREPGYCPPMIYTAAGKRQLIIWHPESVNSLDPETGKLNWTVPFTAKMGLSIPTPRNNGDQLFLTSFYNGSLMLQFTGDASGVKEVWRRAGKNERNTDALHSIISTPSFDGDYIYGVCSYGQLRCLKASNGDRVWETFAATTGKEERWANAFLIKQGDRYFLANDKGDLIIARLLPDGYHEISRAHLLEPTNTASGREVVWSHPAFANRSIYMRNDKEIICASLAE